MARWIFLLGLVGAAVVLSIVLRSAPPEITLTEATAIPAHGAPGAYILGVTMANPGPADRLMGARLTDGAALRIINPEGPMDLVIPGQGTGILAMDGAHLLLAALPEGLSAGGFVPITLEFASAGVVATRAQIGTMADMDHSGGLEPAADAEPVTVQIRPDGAMSSSGLSVAIQTTGFRFTNVDNDAPHVPGEGHAHLYLNGLKLGRIYQPRATVGALLEGQYLLRISLNTNTHKAYLRGGVPVSDTLDVAVGAQ